MEPYRQRLTPLQAKEKLKAWCAYSERCQSEVREKLFGHGLNTRETDEILSFLIEEGFVNEERYARQYAGGHFRMKQWGRVKIKFGLKSKGISEYCIKKGLAEIDEDSYLTLLSKLARQKWESTRGTLPAARWAKTRQFLLQRGFESNLVLDELKRLEKGH
ncbi:MAG: RecX family transcriptional regulator [Chitinophagaceae bacterium]|jgi:regulatory protein|nr:RecX family transcriptional regulator [Chitinophagaceae bacterium]